MGSCGRSCSDATKPPELSQTVFMQPKPSSLEPYRLQPFEGAERGLIMIRVNVLGIAAAVAAGLMLATATQAAPAFDSALSQASSGDVTHVQYYGYGRRRNYGYGESPQHYYYRQAHRAYRQEHRAYRAERFYRYGY